MFLNRQKKSRLRSLQIYYLKEYYQKKRGLFTLQLAKRSLHFQLVRIRVCSRIHQMAMSSERIEGNLLNCMKYMFPKARAAGKRLAVFLYGTQEIAQLHSFVFHSHNKHKFCYFFFPRANFVRRKRDYGQCKYNLLSILRCLKWKTDNNFNECQHIFHEKIETSSEIHSNHYQTIIIYKYALIKIYTSKKFQFLGNNCYRKT